MVMSKAIEYLSQLVSMSTITDDAPANELALDYMQHFVAKRGMHCQRYVFDGHGALLASTRPNNALCPTIILAGHTDVVVGNDNLFHLREEKDRLLGRGVYDMKFALAGYLQLIDELKDNLADYDFALMITTDEEYGGRDDINGTMRLVEQGCRPQACILPDAAAPGWNIEQLAKGFWRFDLVAKGKTAHGSRPWEGESASFKLIAALHEIKEAFRDHGPLTDTLNIGVIQGGETYNLIPNNMKAAVEVRFISHESQAELLNLIAAICQRHDISYHERVTGPAVTTDTSHPLVRLYADSVAQVTGRRPEAITSYAGTDSSYFAAVDVPCIVSCPQGGKHHSDEEWIDRESFLQFVPILREFLHRSAYQPHHTRV